MLKVKQERVVPGDNSCHQGGTVLVKTHPLIS